MSKTVTLRLPDGVYRAFKTMAEQENRTLSGFIETAALRYIQETEFADEFEMREINADSRLKAGIEKGWKDYRSGKYEIL